MNKKFVHYLMLFLCVSPYFFGSSDHYFFHLAQCFGIFFSDVESETVVSVFFFLSVSFNGSVYRVNSKETEELQRYSHLK